MKIFKRFKYPIFITLSVIVVIAITLITVYPIVDGIGKLEHGVVVAVTKDGERTFGAKNNGSWAPLKSISRLAVRAIVISEDSAFYQHDGIDFDQLNSAIRDTILYGKKARGASTISQQLVKNLFFSSDRSFVRKAFEALATIYMEEHLTKGRILEVYLNVIEYGPGIYGIKNAARYYFGKHPYELNVREGAFLAMLLPQPKKYSVSFTKKELSPYASKTINQILEKMKAVHIISDDEWFMAHYGKFSWEIQTADVTPPSSF